MDYINASTANYQRSAFPPETPVAMAYVPFQKFQPVIEPTAALMQGTIFPDLYKPWLDGGRFANKPPIPTLYGFQKAMNQTASNEGVKGDMKNG